MKNEFVCLLILFTTELMREFRVFYILKKEKRYRKKNNTKVNYSFALKIQTKFYSENDPLFKKDKFKIPIFLDLKIVLSICQECQIVSSL